MPGKENKLSMGTRLNDLAKSALECTFKRGKLSRLDSEEGMIGKQLLAIGMEMQEVAIARERMPSEHVPGYTERQEEAADIIISILGYLFLEEVDIDKLIEDKMRFNEARED